MMESRRSYGWSDKPGRLSKPDQQKWEIAYRTDDGGFGICGYAGLCKTSKAGAFRNCYQGIERKLGRVCV